MVEEKFALASKDPEKGVGMPVVVTEADLLKFNRRWDPFNPLFNDKEYAEKAG